ncbi:MAG TPA: PA14 domain-containing protein [Kofleriaceae bacterium]|nr:PA14 domain-containing protein [Kofleriaceae bacterium]
MVLRWALPLLGACGFSNNLASDDAPGDEITIIDDALDGIATDGVVRDGALEPDGFVVGGLHARGFQVMLVDPAEDFTKVLADAAAATPTGTGYGQVPVSWGGARPRGLGLTGDSAFTVIYDGEILLPKGEIKLEADIDDRGLVELALDPSSPTTFGATIAVGVVQVASTTFTTREAGWYPIRAAVSDDQGNAKLALTIVQGQVRTPIDVGRLRARVTNAPGVLVYAFDGPHFIGAAGVSARPTIDESFGTQSPPYDLTSASDQFSLRFAGQLRIDTAGTYAFTAAIGPDASDSFRIWIDGTPVAYDWPGQPMRATGEVMLAPGWHSILVDYMDAGGNAEIEVRMTGPDAPAGGRIDPARLRPVVVFGNTYTVASATPAAMPLQDLGSIFVPLPLPGVPNELIDAVDYGFRIENQDMSSLAVTLFDCSAGKPLVLGRSPGTFAYSADTSCAGKPVNPTLDWTLRFTDTSAGNGMFSGPGQVRDVYASVLYHGGPNLPFAPVITYTSPARPTPRGVQIASVVAAGSLEGADVTVEVRSAPDEASLANAPWVSMREGTRAEASELLQYRLTITHDGWHFPVLDTVEIVYFAAR